MMIDTLINSLVTNEEFINRATDTSILNEDLINEFYQDKSIVEQLKITVPDNDEMILEAIDMAILIVRARFLPPYSRMKRLTNFTTTPRVSSQMECD